MTKVNTIILKSKENDTSKIKYFNYNKKGYYAITYTKLAKAKNKYYFQQISNR